MCLNLCMCLGVYVQGRELKAVALASRKSMCINDKVHDSFKQKK